MSSASGAMEGVSATGTSVLIFGLDLSSGETSAFLSNRGGGGGGGTRTSCEDFVSLCFAKPQYLDARQRNRTICLVQWQ